MCTTKWSSCCSLAPRATRCTHRHSGRRLGRTAAVQSTAGCQRGSVAAASESLADPPTAAPSRDGLSLPHTADAQGGAAESAQRLSHLEARAVEAEVEAALAKREAEQLVGKLRREHELRAVAEEEATEREALRELRQRHERMQHEHEELWSARAQAAEQQRGREHVRQREGQQTTPEHGGAATVPGTQQMRQRVLESNAADVEGRRCPQPRAADALI